MKKGYFITFEGGEGSGKSTQVKFLANRLLKLGLPVVITKEPGSPHLEVCKRIREIILDKDGLEMRNETELFLYIADRVEHVPFIKDCLVKGNIVISDRHDDSTFAYQHYARGLNYFEITALNTKATNGLEPDLTFLLDIDPEDGFRRLKNSHDRLEKTGIEFHKKVNEGYRQLAKEDSRRFFVLDATGHINETKEKIFQETISRLQKADLRRKGEV